MPPAGGVHKVFCSSKRYAIIKSDKIPLFKRFLRIFPRGSARIKIKGLNFIVRTEEPLWQSLKRPIRNKNLDKLLRKLENEIPDSSWSADLEAGSDFKEGDARCSVRVFERYSMMGGNRLSLTLTMFQNADSPIRLSAITAGGSQAVFFKVNTLGEESFLDDVKDLRGNFGGVICFLGWFNTVFSIVFHLSFSD